MSITYTIPATFPARPKLAGKTLTGGRPAKGPNGERAVSFPAQQGCDAVTLGTASRPDLAAQAAECIAADKLAAEAREAAQLAFERSPEGQRELLARECENTYSPEHYPGSRAWQKNKVATDALRAFDDAHPEIVAAINAARAAKHAADYEALSDFVKNGS